MKKRFNNFKKKILYIVPDFKDENCFDVDWSEIFSIVECNFGFLENEGMKFDFNDSVIKRFVKNDVEMFIPRLTDGETVDILGFPYFNDFNDGKEIIKDLQKIKDILDSEFYCEVLEKVLYVSNKGRPHFDFVLMFKIIVLQILYDYFDNSIVKWVKIPHLNGLLIIQRNILQNHTFWEFIRKIIDNLKKRHLLSRKNRKISPYMYKKPKKHAKTNKDKNFNLKIFTIKKVGHTFTKMQL